MTQAAKPNSPDITRLSDIMARLRDKENGCPWDIEQTFETIAPYTIEEAYEVVGAIEDKDMAALCDELGDLLLQVVFHSRMAEEAGHFSLQDVIDAISDKMIRRHPHIFADVAVKDWDWEAIKAEERSDAGAASAMDGVTRALPALKRAQKLQKRAARTGFDWDDAEGARAKLVEEIGELDGAEGEAQREEEFGDLLFAAVNWGRKLGIDAEAALTAGNAKFERRYRVMEELAGAGFEDKPLVEKEEYWEAAKARLASAE